MSQHNKKPLLYGKSHLNRLDTYLGSTRRTSVTRDLSKDHAGSSSRTSQLPFNSSSFPANEQQDTMQRKRRKYLDEDGRETHSKRGREGYCIESNLPTVESQGYAAARRISPGGISRRPACDLSGQMSASTTGGPKQQITRGSPPEKTVTPPNLDCENRTKPQGYPNLHKKEKAMAPVRKRLVDSLGTVSHEAIMSDKESECSSPCEPEVSDQDNAEYQRLTRRSTQNLASLETSNMEHIRRDNLAQMSPKLRSSKVTYSRQRSFLNEDPGFEDQSISITSLGKGSQGTDRASASLLNSGIEDDESNPSKPVRSIHELRQAGDNARFRETVDSIFDDIEDTYNSISGRCCGFAQLCERLLETQFVRRFSEHGFDQRLADCTTSKLDVVSASLALSAYWLIQSNGSSSYMLSGTLWGTIIKLAPTLLDEDDDILLIIKNSSLGLSKTAQASVRSVRPHILSAMNSLSPVLSPHLLTLECIRLSLVSFRERRKTIDPIPVSLLGHLIGLSVPIIPENLSFPLSTGHFQSLSLIFSTLENYIILSGPLDYDSRCCFQRLTQLYRLLESKSDDQCQKVLSLYTRVILNLTNKEPLSCKDFATPELVSRLVNIITTQPRELHTGFSAQESSALNTVILALGALTNLAEKTEESRAVFLQSNGNSLTFVHQLLEKFGASIGSIDQAHSVPEVHHSVVTGYLSILLLTICLNIEALSLVRLSLGGNGLALILSTAEKFLQYHRKIEQDSCDVEPRSEEGSKLTVKLEHLIGRIRQNEDC